MSSPVTDHDFTDDLADTASDRQEPGMYGPRGWTVRAGVWEVVDACRDELRATRIPAGFGLGPQSLIVDGVPEQDYTPFHDMGPRHARRLIEILPAEQLADRQNLAPTLGTFLAACVRAQGRVRLSGYGIGPQRQDERLSVEGMWVADTDLLDLEVCERHDEQCQCGQIWDLVNGRYHLDAQGLPDEIGPRRRLWDHGEVGTWLWWD